MSTEIFALVFIAATLHATWNLISKRAAPAGWVFVFAYRLFATVLYAPWVVYVLWADKMVWSAAVVGFILLSSIIHLFYGLCLQYGYQVADLSVVYPIARGTGPLLATLGAYLWLEEPSSVAGASGMMCIVGGVLLIATRGRWQLFVSAQSWVGVRWGLLIGLFIACYTLADAYSVKQLHVAPVVLDWLAGLGITLLMAPKACMQRGLALQRMRGRWGLALAVGALSPMGYILVLYALQQGALVSLVAPLREMSLMIATLASYLLFKEKVGLARWAGCAAVILGVALLSSR